MADFGANQALERLVFIYAIKVLNTKSQASHSRTNYVNGGTQTQIRKLCGGASTVLPSHPTSLDLRWRLLLLSRRALTRNSLNKIRKSGQRQENYQAILESLVNEAAREGKSSVRTARSAAVEPATTTLLKIEEHTQESWA